MGWFGCWFVCASAFAGAEKIPDLQPARGELSPTFWETHAWTIVFSVVAVAVVVQLIILWLRRPKFINVTPPESLAREAMEAMRGNPEDGELLVRVSRILRHYVMLALQLPAGEMTTSELLTALKSRPEISTALAAGIGGFLRQCDERKFSPSPPPSAGGAVATALGWMDQIDRQRKPSVPPAVATPGEAIRASS